MADQLDSAWRDERAGGDLVRPGFRSTSAQRTVELFEEFHAGLFRYMMTLTEDSAEAEDLMQEAFLRLFRELGAGAAIRDPRAWLFTVGHRLAIDFLRQRRQASSAEAGIADRQPNPEAAAIQVERDRWFANAISSLSPQQRQCLSLRVEGLRYREIASVLGVQISTVRTMIVRAVNRLSGGPK